MHFTVMNLDVKCHPATMLFRSCIYKIIANYRLASISFIFLEWMFSYDSLELRSLSLRKKIIALESECLHLSYLIFYSFLTIF